MTVTAHQPKLVAGPPQNGLWQCVCGAKIWIEKVRSHTVANGGNNVWYLSLRGDCGWDWSHHVVPMEPEPELPSPPLPPTDWSEYGDERLVESYMHSVVAKDPAFQADAGPIRHELLKRLFRGRHAYAAVQKAQASTRSTSWVWLWLLALAVGLVLGGLR